MARAPESVVIELLRRRLVRPVLEQLTQGLSPDAVALTIAIGLAIAVVPVVGTTTVLCAAVALALRLNQPLIQAINYLSFPLQIAFILPYLKLGRLLFGGPAIRMSAHELAALFSERPAEAVEVLGRAALQAFGAWLLTAPIVAGVVFLAVRPVLRAAARRLRGVRTPWSGAPPGAGTASPGLAAVPLGAEEERDGR